MVDEGHLQQYVNATRSRFEDLLGQMVEVPSISMDPSRAPDVRRMAVLAAQSLTDLGAEAAVGEEER